MTTALPGAVVRLFRIPGDPTPPPGDPSKVRAFRAGRKYYWYKLFGWGLGQLLALAVLFGGTVFSWLAVPWDRLPFLRDGDLWGIPVGALALGGPAWILYLAQIPLTYLAVRLDYEMRSYILAESALRIRHGVFSIREQTMTYANIQHIAVRRGPLQQLLGIGDVEVRTAGGGEPEASGKNVDADMHRGFFRGVDDAEGVRDAIRARVDAYRDAGLGDPDEHHGPTAARGPGSAEAVDQVTVEAARTLLGEVRLLRSALTGRGPR
jgi:hypothetical protein